MEREIVLKAVGKLPSFLNISLDKIPIPRLNPNPLQQLKKMQKPQKSEPLYSLVPQLKISQSGIFKYILIICKHGNPPIEHIFIRGSTAFEYHSQNFDDFFKELKKSGAFTQLKKGEGRITGERDGEKYEWLCPGGGRIQHQVGGVKCSIYGYSQSYGHVDHGIARWIIAKELGYPLEEIKLNQKEY